MALTVLPGEGITILTYQTLLMLQSSAGKVTSGHLQFLHMTQWRRQGIEEGYEDICVPQVPYGMIAFLVPKEPLLTFSPL